MGVRGAAWMAEAERAMMDDESAMPNRKAAGIDVTLNIVGFTV